MQDLKTSAWIIYFRCNCKKFYSHACWWKFLCYLSCSFFPANFEFQHSNFKIRCPQIWDEMNTISIQACRVHNSWKKLIKKMLPYIHNCFCIIDTWVHESSIFVVGKKSSTVMQVCRNFYVICHVTSHTHQISQIDV